MLFEHFWCPAGDGPAASVGTLDNEMVVFVNRGSDSATVHNTQTEATLVVAAGDNPLAVAVVQ